MISEELVEEARKWHVMHKGEKRSELSRIANEKGQFLAEKLGADKNLVMIGTMLMDIKRKQAFEEGRAEEHVNLGVESVREFLSKHKIDKTDKDKIINCIAAHHGDVQFICKEAEIVANADCYKFLTFRGSMIAFGNWTRKLGDFDKASVFIESKVDEKYNTLSLDLAKQELEPNYPILKQVLRKAREK